MILWYVVACGMFTSFVAGVMVGRVFALRRIVTLARRFTLLDELEHRRHHEAKLASMARHPSRQSAASLQLLTPKHDDD